MTYTIILFGITKEIVGKSSISIDLAEQTSVAQLMSELKQQYSALQTLKSLAVAVNSEYAEADLRLQAGDEIALIPPVSGG